MFVSTEFETAGDSVSYSRDMRHMHIDTARAGLDFLVHELRNLSCVNSKFKITYFRQGERAEILSDDLKTDDPEEDLMFIERTAEEIMAADYAEVETILQVPQCTIPDNEFLT